jgi:hypothetical protein
LSPPKNPGRFKLKRLDDVVGQEQRAHFVKIDVEGAELEVLRGAEQMLRGHRPIVYFECAKVHHAHYDTKPEDVYDFLVACGFRVALLDQRPLTRETFVGVYEQSHASDYDRTAWGNYWALPA